MLSFISVFDKTRAASLKDVINSNKNPWHKINFSIFQEKIINGFQDEISNRSMINPKWSMEARCSSDLISAISNCIITK